MSRKMWAKALTLSWCFSVLIGCGGNQGDRVSQGNQPAPVPTVTGITPSAITSSSLPRTITVDGTGFQSGLAVSLTTPSGSSQPTPSQVASTSFQITAVFGNGSYSIAVTNPDGQRSSSFAFSAKTATGINFAPVVNYATGATTSGPGGGSGSIALQDFNGDGKLDIAVSNYASNTIAVFLNKGDGTFGSPVMTTVNPLGALGLGPVVAGDFNEDGKMDLIVATIAGGQSNIVLLGKGDGTFTQGSAIPNSFGFIQAKAVDLNGDKHLDLVASDSGNVSVALGKGDGTFGPTVTYSNGPFPDAYFGFDLGDIAGTGNLDIVTADPFSAPGSIFVFPGNGDGTFGTLSAQPTPVSYPDFVALADFNDDGKLDLLIGYSGGQLPSPQASAQLALGNGDYTFALGTETSIYTSNFGGGGEGIIVRAADVDQDGKPDVLVVDYFAGTFTLVLNNAPSISAGTQYTFTIAPDLSDIAVGDLNGDGMPDVVLVNDQTDQISVLLSQSQ